MSARPFNATLERFRAQHGDPVTPEQQAKLLVCWINEPVRDTKPASQVLADLIADQRKRAIVKFPYPSSHLSHLEDELEFAWEAYEQAETAGDGEIVARCLLIAFANRAESIGERMQSPSLRDKHDGGPVPGDLGGREEEGAEYLSAAASIRCEIGND